MENQVKSPAAQPPRAPGLLQRLDQASKCSCSTPTDAAASRPVRLVRFLRERQCLVIQLVFIAIMLYLIAGCQSTAPAPQLPASEPQQEQTAPAPAVRDFAPGTMLSLLTAEIAGYRDQPLLALENYTKQAKTTREPEIASRAYEIADYLSAHSVSYYNAMLWTELEPDSAAARRAAALELSKNGEYKQASDHLRRAIELEPDGNYLDLVAVAASHADSDSRHQLQLLLEQLLQEHPANHGLLLSLAILQLDQRPLDAFELLEQIDNQQASSNTLHVKARMLEQLDQLEAGLATQSLLLEREPRDENAHKFRARLLIKLGRLEDARSEFLTLAALDPYNDDYRLSLGYIHMDMQAWDEALVYFDELLERGSHREAALYSMAVCHSELGNNEQALAYYQLIDQGQYWLPALEQQALLYLRNADEQAIQTLLAHAASQYPEQRQNIHLVEVRALMTVKAYRKAYAAADQALAGFPGQRELLYLRALAAERIGNLEQLEQDLRSILAQNPQDSTALNALGYTLVDRTNRIQEGFELIEQALLLNPSDPPTLDSMGWAYFRLQQYQQALDYLKRAMRAMPDAEIAAHLGEVHWVTGARRKARQTWQQGMELDDQNDVLLETIRRLDNRKSWFD